MADAKDIKGSPPHMRGKGRMNNETVLDLRITPAHAGKSRSSAVRAGRPWDHPRTCGEKVQGLNPCGFLLGSPPHMRGKAALKAASYDLPGITPAHAGKSVPC